MKFAVPGTFVPGAVYIGSITGKRHAWQMPKPVAFVERMQVVREVVAIDDKLRTVLVKKLVQFPVYRGMSASLARTTRATARRAQRKLKEMQLKAHKESARDMLRKFVTEAKIRQTIEDVETGYCEG